MAVTAAAKDHTIQPLRLDVTDVASVIAAAATVTAAGTKLDALVNNAGVLLERKGCSLSEIVEPTMAVNIDGVAVVTEAFLPLMADGGEKSKNRCPALPAFK